MAKARIMNYRQQAKRSSTIALVLSMLLMLTVVLLMLLALGILSLPVSDTDLDSNPISNHFKFNRKFINHINNNNMYVFLYLLFRVFFGFFLMFIWWLWWWFVCCSVDSDVSESRDNQWTEILSWEPRAFLYHNFLVIFSVIFMILFVLRCWIEIRYMGFRQHNLSNFISCINFFWLLLGFYIADDVI